MTTNFANAALYVGDLEPEITESTLFETFKTVGTVASIRVCRDSATRRSLGYGYVNFQSREDAERAIEQLNFQPIAGTTTPIRIMWSHRDPAARRSGKGNIFIKNLPESVDNKALYDTFSDFGKILSCKVATDSEGKSRGFGFVHFAEEEDAKTAIDTVNGAQLEDKVLFVGPFKPKKVRDTNGEIKFTNCYVKDLDLETTEDELRELFGKFGTVDSVFIKRDGEGKSRGFGFVNFEKPEDARKAVEELNGHELKANKIYVARAQKKSEREAQLKRQFEERKQKYAESNLFIKNLDSTIDDAELRGLFEAFGTIISARVMREEDTEVSKGFGFVCLSTPEEAHKAIADMNGRMVKSKPLYVALAQPKAVRTAQLQAQAAHRQAGRGMPMVGRYPGQPVGMPFPPQPGMPRQPFPAGAYPPPAMGMPPFMRGAPNPAAAGGAGNFGGPFNAATAGAPPGARKPAQPEPAQPSLADLSEKERKQVLGEFLYPKIESLLKTEVRGDVGDTGKITGMLLESLDHGELLHLVESPNELKNRVEEAIGVLREHYQQQQAGGEQ